MRSSNIEWFSRFRKGCISVCSSNQLVIESVFREVKAKDIPIFIESTANQVNQFGGYTNLTPIKFKEFVFQIADKIGLPYEKIFLGGDHLGAYVWNALETNQALDLSKELIREYIKAGFVKLHIDMSMPLGHERFIDKEIIAFRTAKLCKIAEECYKQYKEYYPLGMHPVYVIGSDVPPPGGGVSFAPEVTSKEELEECLDIFQYAFKKEGVSEVFNYVVAVVANFGVDFTADLIFDFNQELIFPLKEVITKFNLVFEGHSTDYQTKENLRQMVKNEIKILKVGPALTYALRESLMGLYHIENELIPNRASELSYFKEVLLKAMMTNKNQWKKYFDENEDNINSKLVYSFLDRWRYYYDTPELKKAIFKLINNLSNIRIPLWLISQYFPHQYEKIRKKALKANPTDIIFDKISNVLENYIYAIERN